VQIACRSEKLDQKLDQKLDHRGERCISSDEIRAILRVGVCSGVCIGGFWGLSRIQLKCAASADGDKGRRLNGGREEQVQVSKYSIAGFSNFFTVSNHLQSLQSDVAHKVLVPMGLPILPESWMSTPGVCKPLTNLVLDDRVPPKASRCRQDQHYDLRRRPAAI